MTDKIDSNEIRERVYRVLGVTEFAVDMMNNSAELRFTEGNRLFVLPYQSR